VRRKLNITSILYCFFVFIVSSTLFLPFHHESWSHSSSILSWFLVKLSRKRMENEKLKKGNNLNNFLRSIQSSPNDWSKWFRSECVHWIQNCNQKVTIKKTEILQQLFFSCSPFLYSSIYPSLMSCHHHLIDDAMNFNLR
jgi:hypothetical protein